MIKRLLIVLSCGAVAVVAGVIVAVYLHLISIPSFTTQRSAAQWDNLSEAGRQQMYRAMLGMRDFKQNFSNRNQVLEALAKGFSDNEWATGEGEFPLGVKNVTSSISYVAKDARSIYRLGIRCEHAFTLESALTVEIRKFVLSDDGNISQIGFNKIDLPFMSAKSFAEEHGTLIGTPDELTVGQELLANHFGVNASGYQLPSSEFPRIYLGGSHLGRTAYNFHSTEFLNLGPYYKVDFPKGSVKLTFLQDALYGEMYFTTETVLQKVVANYLADPIFKACLIPIKD